MSEPRDHHGYPLKPRQIGDRIWYYETSSGIDVHIDVLDVQAHVAFQIPWRRVEAALRNRIRARQDVSRRGNEKA